MHSFTVKHYPGGVSKVHPYCIKCGCLIDGVEDLLKYPDCDPEMVLHVKEDKAFNDILLQYVEKEKNGEL